MEVEIWSDVACPWCYIGKRRFEAALSQFEHSEDVQVRWRSFELDGEAPHERMGDRAEHLAKKYGMTVEQAREAGQGDRFTAEVRDDERTAGELGISAVPTFVVDRKLGTSGAQPPEALLELLREGWTRSNAAVAT
ncbi:MAG TPA: DsbA family protein [Solirubrobacteraceae bacterium]|jgi:predicted DsbA family dithiol-disulfide isomerase|nr:DsbA family protein [Solirubrobacteraceae bacterium]